MLKVRSELKLEDEYPIPNKEYPIPKYPDSRRRWKLIVVNFTLLISKAVIPAEAGIQKAK